MNKAFYIIGIVFSVIFLFLTAYYSEEVSDAKRDYLFSDFSYSDYGYSDYGYSSYNSYSSGDEYKDLSTEAALWSLFFFLSFITIDLLGLLKVKTKTTKVLSIIGLSISAIFLLWNFGVMFSPGSISFDEVSPAWGFYCFVTLAFSIIGLVQSVRFSKGTTSNSTNSISGEKDLLDS